MGKIMTYSGIVLGKDETILNEAVEDEMTTKNGGCYGNHTRKQK